jgi:hypothetical protein
MKAILNNPEADSLSKTGAERVTIKRASEITGYSESAIRNKIFNGIWPENIVWKWGPDGVQLIILEGYNTWTNQNGKVSRRGRHQSASSLCLTGTNTTNL